MYIYIVIHVYMSKCTTWRVCPRDRRKGRHNKDWKRDGTIEIGVRKEPHARKQKPRVSNV